MPQVRLITKGLVTGLLGQVHSSSNERCITTSTINTRNIVIRDENAQIQLGTSSAEMIAKVNKDNIHQSVNQVDGSQLQSEIENDLAISKSFVNNINSTGDEIYYRMEKNEDSIFSIQKTRSDCNHIDCLTFDEKGKNLADNSQELKAILYSDKVLTEEQAELFSRIGTAGMLNFTSKDKVASAILYGDDLASIDETPTILNRGSAGFVNEFIFAGFERFRAWINMPAIFGASNATRDHAQIAKKLDEYNAHAKLNGNKEVPLFNVAHSLAVSENKNMLNWSEYMNQSYNNTKVTYWNLGGSYTHVGDANSQTTLESGATTNLKGAQVQGKGVKLDAQNLNIESLQETL
ncbi:hemagglutinin repeat-containing protein, partial [Actinobacillus porcinus]